MAISKMPCNAGLRRAPTDHGWYQFLRARPELDEVNFWRPGATPFAALVATLVDVFVRDHDPAREEVPAMLFPGQEVEPDRSRKTA